MKTISNTRRWVLMNPGPVNVTPRVRRALLLPDICHREEEFSTLLRTVREKLLTLFGVRQTHTIAVFSGSGTTALEAMLSSFAKNDKKILVLSNGVYGDRIKKILEVHDTPVLVLTSDVGDFPDFRKVEALLKNDTSIHAIAMVHHETSSGMLNPVAKIGELAKKYRKTFLVDAISSLGAEEMQFKKWGVDACAGTSGKCLHGFPGVSFVIISKKTARALKHQKPKTLYLDLSQTLESEEKGDTPFTPAVQIFYAFNEALTELLEEGLARRIRSYREKSALLEKGLVALGLGFLIDQKHRSHVLTALWTPSQISYESLHEALKKQGFIIYAGQSHLKGKIFRVSHLGDVQKKDIQRFLTCLKTTLKKSSHRAGILT